MGFADLHLHSIYSHDGASSVEAILFQANQRKLDVIAITDHDSMDGVIEALLLMKKYAVQVIPAMEITTAQGHLLAYEIKAPIQRGLSLIESVTRVKEQNGFCIIPHPKALGGDAIRANVLDEVMRNEDLATTILGIEAINGGLIRMNFLAKNTANQFGLSAIGNSDGHNIDSIGRAVTNFEGTSIQELKTSLQQKKTKAQWHHRTFDPIYYGFHMTNRFIRSMGFGFNLNPETKRFTLTPVANLRKSN